MQNLIYNKRTFTAAFFLAKTGAASRVLKAVFICLLLMAGSFNSFSQLNTWVQKSDLGYDYINVPEPTPRYEAVGFSIAGKGYTGTGFKNDYKKDFWEYDPIVNAWTQKADFGGDARWQAVGFSIGTKGYVGTGANGFMGVVFNDFWEYDPATNAWTRKADFGGIARTHIVGFSIGSKGYIGTGEGVYYPNSTKEFWEYDPATNTWTQKADFGGVARLGAAGFSIGEKGYIGTGLDYPNQTVQKDFWEYDPLADTWTQKADFGGLARQKAVGLSIGGKGYIGTGVNANEKFMHKDFWEYDPSADAWVQKANLGGAARDLAVGFSISGKGYIGMGYNYTIGLQKDFWEYNPAANAWVHKADFGGTARSGAVGFSIGSKGYIGTGGAFGNTKDFREYDTAANAWTQKADFGGIARKGAIGFSMNGKGYIGTGYDYNGNYSVKKDFWEYDPATNAWTQKANFGGTARWGAVGFSIGSKGYVGTGYNNDSSIDHYYKDFWEYDPAANTWKKKADFRGAARTQAVGFNTGSKGYVGTGYNGGYAKDFWEYDPAVNTWTRKADFSGAVRDQAVGFSINGKGYVGMGYGLYPDFYKKDFWEYDPAVNVWTQKADFGGTARDQVVGFSIGSKGYIGTGYDYNGSSTNEHYYKDFWEYTPDNTCHAPTGLKVLSVSDTGAVVQWNNPAAGISYVQLRYRAKGDTIWKWERRDSAKNTVFIKNLVPVTIYQWQLRSLCAENRSDWVKGPDFTTTSSSGSIAKSTVYPNPADNVVTINYTAQKSGKYIFEITGISSNVLLHKEANAIQGENRITLDISKFAKGIFFINIINSDKTRERLQLSKE